MINGEPLGSLFCFYTQILDDFFQGDIAEEFPLTQFSSYKTVANTLMKLDKRNLYAGTEPILASHVLATDNDIRRALSTESVWLCVGERQ